MSFCSVLFFGVILMVILRYVTLIVLTEYSC